MIHFNSKVLVDSFKTGRFVYYQLVGGNEWVLYLYLG
jgi:hypothetical protein